MAFEMSTQSLRKLCRERGQYSSRLDLNDVLHLACKGIAKIQGLDSFTGLTTIYLESNAISEVEGLEPVPLLRCLYLAKNFISSTSGFGHLVNLQVLDLADNNIARLDGLESLTRLRSLNVSGNKLKQAGDLSVVAKLPELETLDLSHNRIAGADVVDLLCAIALKWLRLVGNPFLKEVYGYRKVFLSRMDSLNYFDDSPAFPRDKRLAHAWIAGGAEAEREERRKINDEDRARRDRRMSEFRQMVDEARERGKTNPLVHDPSVFVAKDDEEVEEVVPPLPSVEAPGEGEATNDPRRDGAAGAHTSAERSDVEGSEPPCEPSDIPEAGIVEAGFTPMPSQENDDDDVAEEDAEGNAEEEKGEGEEEEARAGDAGEGSLESSGSPDQDGVPAHIQDIATLDMGELAARESLHRHEMSRRELLRATQSTEERTQQQSASPFYKRPVVWGTSLYRQLWASASAIPDGEGGEAGDTGNAAPDAPGDAQAPGDAAEDKDELTRLVEKFNEKDFEFDSDSDFDPMEPYTVGGEDRDHSREAARERKAGVEVAADESAYSSSEEICIIERKPDEIDFEAMD